MWKQSKHLLLQRSYTKPMDENRIVGLNDFKDPVLNPVRVAGRDLRNEK